MLNKPLFQPREQENAIPKILHHVFFTGFSSLPAAETSNLEKLRAENPDWEHLLHDEDSSIAFIDEKYGSKVRSAYESIDPDYCAARSDLLRYLICYEIGGVYLDVKATAIRPLSEIIAPSDAYVVSHWVGSAEVPDRWGTTHPKLAHIPKGEYINWFIASAPGHPFLEAVINRVLSQIRSYKFIGGRVGRSGVLNLTGPISYTLAINPIIEEHKHKIINYYDSGLRYSIHDNLLPTRTGYQTHYSKLKKPIIKGGGFAACVRKTAKKVRSQVRRG